MTFTRRTLAAGVLVDSEPLAKCILLKITAEAGVKIDAKYADEAFLGKSLSSVCNQMCREHRINRPRNVFVAGFIGSPKMKIFTGPEAEKHGATSIGIRSEHTDVSTTEGAWKGRVGVAEHLGSDTFIHVRDTRLADTITVRITCDISARHGDTIYLSPRMDQMHKFDEYGLRIP